MWLPISRSYYLEWAEKKKKKKIFNGGSVVAELEGRRDWGKERMEVWLLEPEFDAENLSSR